MNPRGGLSDSSIRLILFLTAACLSNWIVNIVPVQLALIRRLAASIILESWISDRSFTSKTVSENVASNHLDSSSSCRLKEASGKKECNVFLIRSESSVGKIGQRIENLIQRSLSTSSLDFCSISSILDSFTIMISLSAITPPKPTEISLMSRSRKIFHSEGASFRARSFNR